MTEDTTNNSPEIQTDGENAAKRDGDHGSLGDRIIYVRVKAGLSRAELVEQLENKFGFVISDGMLLNVECSISHPTIYQIKMIADFFGVYREWLAWGEYQDRPEKVQS